jgi:hypothetical protein
MGLVGVPGMELTTREEVHVVCLFPDPDSAERFSDYVYTRLPKSHNKPWLFGEQVYIGSDDKPEGHETRLLLDAADIGIYDTAELAGSCGGLAFPAHIDRSSFSLLSNLGLWDDAMGFRLCEYHDPPPGTHPIDARNPAGPLAMPAGAGQPVRHVTGSDAHRLADIRDGRYALSIAEPTALAVLDTLRKL